jgi:hypothetical protein
MTISTRQYRKFLDALDISQQRFAKMLGIDPRTSRRYALDENEIPEMINIVLRLMIKHRYTPEKIDELKQERLL